MSPYLNCKVYKLFLSFYSFLNKIKIIKTKNLPSQFDF
jgi:hypothetical protein